MVMLTSFEYVGLKHHSDILPYIDCFGYEQDVQIHPTQDLNHLVMTFVESVAQKHHIDIVGQDIPVRCY